MKKNILPFLILLLISQTTQSQSVSKGVAVGLQSAISSSNTTYSFDKSIVWNYETSGKKTTYKIIPSVNYFLTSRWAIGLGVGYSQTKETHHLSVPAQLPGYPNLETDVKASVHQWMLNPSLTYYFPVGDRAYLFLRGVFNYSEGKANPQVVRTKMTYNDPDIHAEDLAPAPISNRNAGIAPGFLFFPAEHWGLEVYLGSYLVGYSSSTLTEYDTTYLTYQSVHTTKKEGWQFLDIATQGLGLSVFYLFK